MARAGAFRASLSPFGQGKLNLEDAYRIEVPTATATPPTPNPAPPRQVGGGSVTHVPVVRPPIVGRAPTPKSASRPARRPTVRGSRPAPRRAPVAAKPPLTVAQRYAQKGITFRPGSGQTGF